MKKIIILVASTCLMFVSCKKDRTCTCSLTQVSSTDNGVAQPLIIQSYTNTNKLTKVTKKSAHCNSGEQTETYTEIQGGTSHTYVNVYKADCKLS